MASRMTILQDCVEESTPATSAMRLPSTVKATRELGRAIEYTGGERRSGRRPADAAPAHAGRQPIQLIQLIQLMRCWTAFS